MWVRIAMLYSEAGMVDNALKVFDEMLERKPWDFKEQSICGVVSVLLGNGFLVRVKESRVGYPRGGAREAAELKREKLAIQRRPLELAEREKRDRDILFHNFRNHFFFARQYNDRMQPAKKAPTAESAITTR
ncbi:pentatricopeptide repeat-containing protein [Tanacetum coccineum]